MLKTLLLEKLRWEDLSRNQLRMIGKRHFKMYDPASVDRILRRLTEAGEVKPTFNDKGYIISYTKI